MPRIKKFSPVQNLSQIQTFVLDDGINSKYFKITEFKETFTGGKNGFLIEGTKYLKEGVEIKIDITDVNGNPVYFEPGDGIPEYYEGTSKLVSVYVYQDTPIGEANITILGELKRYEDETGLVRDIPDEWKGIYNVKWQRTFAINKNIQNEDRVRFVRRPQVNIDEIVKPVFSVSPRTKTHSGSLDGAALSPSNGTNIDDYTLPTTYRLFRNTGPSFSGSMVGNQIQFDNLQYTPTILDVVNDEELVVDTPYTENSIVRPLTNGLYTSSFIYLEDGDELATALTASFAKIKITDMKTFVGDAARVKVFRRSQSQLTDFEFVQEIQLESNELLRDLDSKNEVETNFGLLTEQIFQNYWITSSNNLTTEINQNILYNSVKLDSVGLNSFFTSQSFDVNQDVEYTLTFNVKKLGSINSDEYVKSFLGSTPGPIVEDTSGAIPCAQASSYTGGESYPTEQTVNLGENTGLTELQFNAINVPDRFIVEWDGNVVIDSGYVGGSEYDFGGGSRATFTSGLTGELDPITGNTYPDFVTYTDDGYPRVTTQANPLLPDGSGSGNFNKTSSSPQLADVKVYAPLGGTAWDLTLFCPQNPPILDVERISNPDTIQEITTLQSSNNVLQKFEVEENFIANSIDDVRLYFEISGSDWYISNISLKASQETSFSPDEITFIQQVPKTLETETFDYRFEFYDINNNFIPVNVDQTKTFTGGNLNLFQKSIELIPDNLYFSFDSASNPANAIPPTVINIDVETTLVTGSINYTSQSFDLDGNLIPSQSYNGATDVYPGLLDTTDNRAPFLTVANFTGSKEENIVQFVRITGEVEGVSDTIIITRVEDGKGGVNFEIRPFRGTSIKNKEDKSLEVQAIRIDGINEIQLRDGLERNFSNAKLRLLSSSIDGGNTVETYVSLSQAITDPNFITGVSAGTTGSGEIDYNAEFNRDAIDNELVLYLMDGPTTESILTSLILNDLKDGLNNGSITTTNNTFTIKPREERVFTPSQSTVTGSFFERGKTESPLSGTLVITPSMSLQPKTELPQFWMFYETGAFEDRITVNVTDGVGNSIESGIPNVTPNVNYTPEQTKLLNVEFIYTEDVTNVQISNSETFTIVPEGLPGQDSIEINIEPNPVNVGANSKGEVSNYELLDTTITVTQGDLPLINTASGDPGTFTTSSIVVNGLEFEGVQGNSLTSMSLSGFNSMSALSASIEYNFDIFPYFTASIISRSKVQKFNKSVDGAGAIEVLIEPINASINADESGFVNADRYGILDTTLKVKQAEEFLVFDIQNLGTPGTYTASIVPNGILIGDISSSSQDSNTIGDDTLHIQNFNSFVINENSASVNYDLVVYPYSLKDGVAGVPTPITRKQVFSKVNDGSAARRVKLTSNTTTIVYNADGDIETPAGSVILTAASSNTTGSVYYRFKDENGNTLQGPLTSNTYTVNDPPASGEQATFTVELLDGGTTAQVFDTDSVTIAAIQSGQSSYNVILSNASSTVEVEVDGTVNLDQTKTEIRAYKAGNELDIVDQFGTTNSGPPDFLPVVINEASASIVDYSSHITLLDNKLGEDSSNLYVTSSGLASWTNPQVNRTAFITYKVDFEDGRSEQQITQTLTAVFEGATGPGLVMRGEWTGSIPYIFDLDQKRRDAVFKDINGSVHYWATTELTPTASVYTDGDEVYTLEPVYTEGVTEEGDIDYDTTWQYLGEQDFFVAAKLAIFEESFVKNTINIGTPPPGEENAKIAIVGGTDEPYISVGQTGIQGFNQPGAFLGLSKDSSAGTTGIFSLSSNQSTAGSNLVYTGLNWDGLTLTVRGMIRQTSTASPLGDIRGNWTAGVTYLPNDIVAYEGNTYTLISTTPITATNDSDIDTGFPDEATNSWTIAIASGTSGTAGGTGKSLSISANSQVYIFDNFGDTTPDNDIINFSVKQQNLTGEVLGSDITITKSDGNTITTPTLTGTITDGTGQKSFDLSFSGDIGDKSFLPITASVTKDGITDLLNIQKIEGGADADPQYFITPLNGTQLKNSTGTLELKIQSSDPVNGLQDITTGDIKIYSGSNLITTYANVSGTDYNPIISADAIFGTMDLILSGSDGILDSITLLDVTDGLGGGSFLASNLKLTRTTSTNQFPITNEYTPSFLSATASFFDVQSTEYQQAFSISASFESETDFMSYETSSTITSPNIEIVDVNNGDGISYSGPGASNKLATKDINIVVKFTDPVSGQSSTINETFYVISDGLDGLDAINVVNSNPSETLPSSNAGVVSDYNNSGTIIEVFEGTASLNYDGVGTSPGTWKINTSQIPDSTITIGSITSPQNAAIIDDHDAMDNGTNRVSIKYSITGSRRNGSEFFTEASQVITKAKAGSDVNLVNLIADNIAISYDQDGLNPSPTKIDLIASSSNFNNAFFKFTGGGGAFTDESTFTDGFTQNTDTASFIVPSSYSQTPYTFRVGVADGDQSELANDILTIFSLKPGADSDPQYFITPLNGTQLKNSSGTLELQVQSSDPINGLQNVTNPSFAIYTGSVLITNISGVTGTDLNPTIDASAIFGTMNLFLSGSDGVLDSLTLLDVTDGLGGGTFKSPNLKTTRDPSDNSFNPLFLSATASFFTPSGVEYTSSVKITPSFDTVDKMAVSSADGDTTNITITAGDGDGGTITLGGSSVATKDTVLVATFTDPNTSQTSTITETFYIVSDGVDGIDALTVALTNPAHNIPADSSGTVSSFDGSGTTIKLFEGTSSLDYDGVGTANGKWTVSATGDGITPGSITEDGKFAIVGNHSSMTEDSASIEYTITGKRLNGSDITDTTAIQSLVKSKAGVDGVGSFVTRLTADNFVITYDQDGLNPSPSSIKLIASSSNFTDGFFKFTGEGGFSDDASFLDGDTANTDERTFTVPSTYSQTPYKFRVGVADGNQVERASDNLSIASVKPGSDTTPQYFITSIAGGTQIKNSGGGIELQVQKSSVDGLDDITSGTDARIYIDTTLLTVQTGITDGGNGVEYNPIISASAIDGTLVLSLRSGSTGQHGVLDTITLVDVTDGLGGGTFLSPNLKTTRDPSDNSFNPLFLSATASFFDIDGSEYTSSVQITPSFDTVDKMAVSNAVGDTTNITITAGDGDGGTITLGGSSVATKDTVLTAVFTSPVTGKTTTTTETFYIISDGADGIDAITVTTNNPSHTVPAAADGTVSSFAGSGIKIEVYEGANKLSYDGGIPPGDSSFSIGNVIVNPTGDFTIDGTPTEGADFIEYGDGTAMNSATDVVTITYGITGSRSSSDEFRIDTTQTITKGKAGSDGSSGADGTDGTDGATGSPGAGVVYRGEWDPTKDIVSTSERKDVVVYDDGGGDDYYVSDQSTVYEGSWDIGTFYQQYDVVLYSGTYYIALNGTISPGGNNPSINANWITYSSPTTPAGLWSAFGAQFESVATDILFANDVYADQTINIGASGSSPVIALNADAANSNANPYISIGQGGSQGYDQNGIFLGFDSTTAKLSLKSGTDSLLWDGTNLIVSGTINASGGSFNETITVGTNTNKITIAGTSTDTTTKIYSGPGTYTGATTGFYLDASGRFSLGDKLSWDGSDLSVTGEVNANAGNFTSTVTIGQGITTGILEVGSGTSTITIQGALLNTSTKLFSGDGNFGNSNTGFYLDATGRFSLSNRLKVDGTALEMTGSLNATDGNIGGWTIGTTTIESDNQNLVLDSSGELEIFEGGTSPELIVRGGDLTENASDTEALSYTATNINGGGTGNTPYTIDETNASSFDGVFNYYKLGTFTLDDIGTYTAPNVDISTTSNAAITPTGTVSLIPLEPRYRVKIGYIITTGATNLTTPSGTTLFDKTIKDVYWEDGDGTVSLTETNTTSLTISNTTVTTTYHVFGYLYTEGKFSPSNTGELDILAKIDTVSESPGFTKGVEIVELTGGGIQIASSSTRFVRIPRTITDWNLDIAGKVRLKQTADTVGGGLRFVESDDDNDYWDWYMGGGDHLYFKFSDAISWNGRILSNVSGSNMNFTGQHRSLPKNVELFNDEFVGMIVSSTGEYFNIDGSIKPTINESLPKVELSNKLNDKRVFGVITDTKDKNDDGARTYVMGSFESTITTDLDDVDRLVVNSLGEGAIWVSNYSGSLENGDYITTSPIPGLGMKQDDDLLHNYTVAKITQDCNFDDDTKYIEVEFSGSIYRKEFVGCTYHCG